MRLVCLDQVFQELELLVGFCAASAQSTLGLHATDVEEMDGLFQTREIRAWPAYCGRLTHQPPHSPIGQFRAIFVYCRRRAKGNMGKERGHWLKLWCWRCFSVSTTRRLL